MLSNSYKHHFRAVCKEKNEIYHTLCTAENLATRTKRKGTVPQSLTDDIAFLHNMYMEKLAELRILRTRVAHTVIVVEKVKSNVKAHSIIDELKAVITKKQSERFGKPRAMRKPVVFHGKRCGVAIR